LDDDFEVTAAPWTVSSTVDVHFLRLVA